VSGANRHDVKLLKLTLAALVIRRPKAQIQHLCADKSYAGRPAEKTMKRHHYVPHVRQRGEEVKAKKRGRKHPARRWVVERTHSWVNRFRKLLVRFEKLVHSYEGLLEIACTLIVFRQCITIYG
jgi:putative transposase